MYLYVCSKLPLQRMHKNKEGQKCVMMTKARKGIYKERKSIYKDRKVFTKERKSIFKERTSS